MKNNIIHIILAFILVIMLVLLSDPFMLWMPPLAVTCAILAVAVIMIVWVGFVMKERVGDEREMLHRMDAGRVAYLFGVAVLTVALIFQGFSDKIDVWIATTLAVMVISKLAARIYFERYR